jgi:Cu-Zn family superoxide dismutase
MSHRLSSAASSAVALSLAALVASACTHNAGSGDEPRRAVAALSDASGRSVGTVDLAERPGDPVVMTVKLTGMTPGPHGIHVHSVGRCDAAGATAFASAGGHFNPATRHHGLENPEGPHAGDMPNVEADASGAINTTVTTPRVTLGDGPTSLLDADGSAIVVHATADDQRSDPAGNSGARVACGVVSKR